MIRRTALQFAAVALLAAAAALLLSSCGASHQDAASPMEVTKGYERVASDTDGAAPAEAGRISLGNVNEARHVIKNGMLTLTVKDARGTVKTVQGIVNSAGGIVSGSQIYEVKEGQYAANLTLRVPVTGFEQMMEQLQELGKADDIKTGDQDVTMEYVELETRIANLKAEEEQLREIMEMANTVEDVLAVSRELSRVRGEAEVMTQQFNYLEDQVSFSTISLYIREELIPTQNISPAPFENLGARLREALVRSINFIMTALAGILVALTALLPVLLVLALIAVIIWRLVARAVKRKTPSA